MTASATPLASGWRLHADNGQGYLVAFPDAWAFVFRDSTTLDADLKAVDSQSPELATYFRSSMAGVEQLRLVAADPRSLVNGFATNVNVMSSDVGNAASAPSLDALAAAKVKHLATDRTVAGPVKQAPGSIAGHPAVVIDYGVLAGARTARVRSYLLVVARGSERFLYEVTMGALPDAADATFVPLAASFAVFPPGHPPTGLGHDSGIDSTSITAHRRRQGGPA